ncbi:unnamed protein product [uncultured virus]|nr:unnamed protein product [uncultured virus]
MDEKHEYEQFFWTANTVSKLIKAFQFVYEDERVV